MQKKGVVLAVTVLLAVVLGVVAGGQSGAGAPCWQDRETIYIYGNGAFTCEIINALIQKKADRNRDGWISTDELRSYVSAAVPKLTADDVHPQGYQHPTVDRDNIYQRFGFPVVESE